MPSSPPPTETLIAALPEVLRPLAQRGAFVRFERGELLIREGERGDTLYIVLAGGVRAFSSDERGKEITFGLYGAGEYVGEMSLDGGPRSASVEATEATLCAMVTRLTLTRHIAAHPEFAFELLGKLIRRARLATQSARNMALLDVYSRLVRQLGGLAVPQPDGSLQIAKRLTHADIAGHVGCSREMVSRLLKDLERGGYLRPDGAGWVLPRPLPQHW
ncbi:MAG: Crp/Fnr family transcriptional regulator [Piscinibacter sp.]|nr:Crp/Fnr family transcriptional regulator [Piscinibacter sp.]